MRRALDWLVVDALGRVAGVHQPALPAVTGVLAAVVTAAAAADGNAANDDSMHANVTRCLTSSLMPIDSPTA